MNDEMRCGTGEGRCNALEGPSRSVGRAGTNGHVSSVRAVTFFRRSEFFEERRKFVGNVMQTTKNNQEGRQEER